SFHSTGDSSAFMSPSQQGAKFFQTAEDQHAHVRFRNAQPVRQLWATQPLEEPAEEDLATPCRQPFEGPEQVQDLVGVFDRLQRSQPGIGGSVQRTTAGLYPIDPPRAVDGG